MGTNADSSDVEMEDKPPKEFYGLHPSVRAASHGSAAWDWPLSKQQKNQLCRLFEKQEQLLEAKAGLTDIVSLTLTKIAPKIFELLNKDSASTSQDSWSILDGFVNLLDWVQRLIGCSEQEFTEVRNLLVTLRDSCTCKFQPSTPNRWTSRPRQLQEAVAQIQVLFPNLGGDAAKVLEIIMDQVPDENEEDAEPQIQENHVCNRWRSDSLHTAHSRIADLEMQLAQSQQDIHQLTLLRASDYQQVYNLTEENSSLKRKLAAAEEQLKRRRIW